MPDKDTIYNELKSTNEADAIHSSKNLKIIGYHQLEKTLYGKFVDGYSRKMWQIDDNKKIDYFSWSPKGVALKEGKREAWDEAISAYPYAINGYDDYFTISTQDAKVLLNTKIEKYDLPNKCIHLNGEKLSFDVIVNTISRTIVMNFTLMENCLILEESFINLFCLLNLPFLKTFIFYILQEMKNLLD